MNLAQLLQSVEVVKARINPRLELTGIVMTMFDGRTNLAKQVVEEVRSHLPDKVLKTVIPRTIRLSEAPSFGKPIILYDAICSGTRHHMDLAKEVLANNDALAPESMTHPQSATGS